MEEEIILNDKETKEAIKLLRSTKFESFEVHKHYYNKDGNPRHGVTLDKAKEIYCQFDKIISASKRPALNGFKYCFVYKLNKKNSYFLIFLLDEKPMKLLNAYYSGKSVEKRLMRKYFGFSR